MLTSPLFAYRTSGASTTKVSTAPQTTTRALWLDRREGRRRRYRQAFFRLLGFLRPYAIKRRKPAISRAFLGGSDGTRTRDLRRDREVRIDLGGDVHELLFAPQHREIAEGGAGEGGAGK